MSPSEKDIIVNFASSKQWMRERQGTPWMMLGRKGLGSKPGTEGQAGKLASVHKLVGPAFG